MAGTAAANADGYAWIGGLVGTWSNPADWADTTNPGAPQAFPGTLTPVTIAGPADAPDLAISGGGTAASIAITGSLVLSGAYQSGPVTLGTLIAANATDPFAQIIAGWLTIAAGSTLTATSLTMLDGDISAAGALSVSGLSDLAQGTLSLAGATAAIGSLALGSPTSAGTLSLTGGTTLTTGAITETDGVVMADGALTQLLDAGGLTLDSTNTLYSPSLDAAGGGLIQAASLSIGAGDASLVIDAASAIEIGAASDAAIGAVTVDQGATIDAASSATITGNLIDNGSILLTAGTFAVSGAIAGSGTLQFGSGSSLAIGAGGSVTPTISGFAASDSIVLTASATSATLSNGGLIVSNNGTHISSLVMAGSFAGDGFFVSPTAAGGSSISLLPNAGATGTGATSSDPETWIGPTGGAWATAADWQEGGAAAPAFPGTLTPVVIAGTSTTTYQIITGGGQAASLALTGLVGLSGSYGIGALAIAAQTLTTQAGLTSATDASGTLLIGAASTVDATALQLGTPAGAIAGGAYAAGAAGSLSVTAGGTLSVTGTADLVQGTLSASGGGAIQLGGIALSGGSIAVDTASTIEVGVRGGAAPGAITVDAGYAIAAAAGALALAGPVTGTGTLAIAAGATLTVSGTIGAGLTIAFGTGATLEIDPAADVAAAITGFAAGDSILLDSLTVTGTSWNAGTLTLDDGTSVVGTLDVPGAYGANGFAVTTVTGATELTLRPGPATTPPDDFSGDGHSAILWQNTDGAPAIWLMNGLVPGATQQQANPGPAWHVVTAGDFTADGFADLLWQNDDGMVAIWQIDGLLPIAYGEVANPGTAWHVMATGDFNGDGNSDILFQNDDGAPAIWEMHGTAIIASAQLANPGPTWHVIGSGDFNGDGYADILWQNDDGMVAIWEMDGLTPILTGDVANPGTTWHAVATGDFNADGKSDILFQNDDGTVAIWEMNGLGISASAQLGNPGSQWHVVGSGDYNGDGHADILFQNNDGTAAIWEINGLTPIATAEVANVPLNWQTIGQGSTHFVNGTESSGTIDATILNDDFVFTSSQPGNHVIVGFDPVHDVISLSAAQFGSFAGLAPYETTGNGAVMLNLGAGSTLTLQGLGIASLTARNIIFS